MTAWTPDRYLELARLCRDKSATGRSPRHEFLRKIAAEYEAKAGAGGSVN